MLESCGNLMHRAICPCKAEHVLLMAGSQRHFDGQAAIVCDQQTVVLIVSLAPEVQRLSQVVFAWAKDVSSQQQIEEAVSGAEVRLFSTELDMLQAWLAFFMEADPDALILFQVCILMWPSHHC